MALFGLLTRALAWLAAALFVATGAMLTYEVVARYFFIRPTIWAAELSQLCLIWGTFLAMAWALGARRHIRIEAVTALMPAAWSRRVETAVMLLLAAFSLMLVWHGGGIFLDTFERGSTTGSMLDLPRWIAELAVPVGFGLLAVQAVIEAVKLHRPNGPS